MINATVLQGRLTADPELRKTSNDISFCEVTVAWSDKYKEKETKCFLRCKAWRGTAEFLSQYFKKGQQIAIEGRLVTEEWEKDGQRQSRTVCDVQKIHFCGSRVENRNQASNTEPAISENDFTVIDDSESLPF